MENVKRNAMVDAAAMAGNQKSLARALKVSEAAVCKWVDQGWAPLERALEIEALFGIPRYDLLSPKVKELLEAVSPT
jgi:DNA-binding transcriptional regulator YdaS (Cro superfamily)